MIEKDFERVRVDSISKVETEIDRFLENSETDTGKYCTEMTRYQLKTGGKRLRALIPCLVFESFGKSAESAVALGAAIEMIHNATLVHDDLQDGDEMRRSQPTVWKKYSEAQAINCGDAMFQYPFRILMRLDVAADLKLKLIDYMAKCTLKVIEGQAQEFIMKEEPSPVLSRYLEIIEGKTSGLFCLPIVGALIALGAKQDFIQAASSAGSKLGLLFQIQDDLLDIYGQKGRDKKATDVAEGKISALVAYVNSEATSVDKQELSRILRLPREKTTDQDIETAIAIFNKYKAKEKAIAFIRQVQKEIQEDVLLKKEPKFHALLNYLCGVFLEPVHSIL